MNRGALISFNIRQSTIGAGKQIKSLYKLMTSVFFSTERKNGSVNSALKCFSPTNGLPLIPFKG